MEIELGLSREENGRAGVRGELFLNFEEVGRIQKYLMENSGSFGFELSPEPLVDANKKGSKKKSIPRGAANADLIGRTGGERKRPRSSRPSYSRELKALLEDGMSILEPKSDNKGGNSQSSMGQRSNVEDFQRKLPDWAKRFHRILKVISQQEVFSPFVSAVNIKNIDLYMEGDSLFSREEGEERSSGGTFTDSSRKKEIDRLFSNTRQFLSYIEKCSPVKPISLSCIINKLENNEYSSAAHVFCDIYSVWICGFRSVEPGKALWTKAVDASLNFNLKLLNEPLQDDFLLTYPGGAPKGSSKSAKSVADGSPGMELPKKAQNTGKGASSTVFEDSGKDPGGYHCPSKGKKSSSLNNHSSQNSSGPKAGKSARKHAQASSHGNKGITEPERHEFQSLLSQLSQNDHVELFNSFFSTAHWKEVNSGEVELDDQQTPPNVFREMIKWCKVKLNIPVPEDFKKDTLPPNKNACKKTRQNKAPVGVQSSQKKKSQLSAKQFFSSGRAFSSPSSSSASEDEDDMSLSGNLQISQQWASTSSSGESDSEPELTSFYPHFNSK